MRRRRSFVSSALQKTTFSFNCWMYWSIESGKKTAGSSCIPGLWGSRREMRRGSSFFCNRDYGSWRDEFNGDARNDRNFWSYPLLQSIRWSDHLFSVKKGVDHQRMCHTGWPCRIFWPKFLIIEIHTIGMRQSTRVPLGNTLFCIVIGLRLTVKSFVTVIVDVSVCIILCRM